MTPDVPAERSESDTSTFEAEIRQRHKLMAQMADREKWDAESRWVVAGRKLAAAALYVAAAAAAIVILWLATTMFLDS